MNLRVRCDCELLEYVQTTRNRGGRKQDDYTMVKSALGKFLSAPVLLAAYRRSWTGLPGMSHLWSGLRIRCHDDAPHTPACGAKSRFSIGCREAARIPGLSTTCVPKRTIVC